MIEITRNDGFACNRILVRRALGWLWAIHEHNIPIQGAQTVEQIAGIAGALEFSPRPNRSMIEIEVLIDRESKDAPKRRR